MNGREKYPLHLGVIYLPFRQFNDFFTKKRKQNRIVFSVHTYCNLARPSDPHNSVVTRGQNDGADDSQVCGFTRHGDSLGH